MGNYEKNKGGILGGLGYVGASLAAGVGSVGEGIVDLLLAGGGLLTGNKDYAEWVFKDNTVGDWYAGVREDYNPGGVMSFVGDVGHGLGQSSVFLLNLIPGLGQLGTAAFFAGVGSQGISGAAATTGEVGLKEVGYGIASGAVEGMLETALGGMGKAVKTLGGSTMKNITKTAVRKGLVKQVLSDAASEFGEEFASEYIDTFLQRGFQIDPNKTTSLRDAIYAGAVGFASGTVSAGTANVSKAIGNQQRGAKIIKNGNSQTLVNTATKVADKLAARGTNFDKAADWVKALRGQVDAYSKLSEGEKTGLRGQTILGEMQSSLYFAEAQSTFDLVQKSIQGADEQTRATYAEYINRSVEKGKRNGRDYTAADIAKNTDDVAKQLAIYKFVPSMFDIDGAIADAQQESAVESVIARNQGAESGAVVGTNEAVVGTNDSVTEMGDSVIKTDDAVIGAEQYELKKDSSGNTYVEVDETIVNETDSPKQIAQTLSGIVRTKFTDFVNVKGQKIGIKQKTAREWVRSKSAETLRKKDNQKFLDKANAFGNADEILQAAKDYIGEATKHTRKDSFVEFARGVVDFKVGDNGYSADVIVGTTNDGKAILYDVVNIQSKKIVASESDTVQDRRRDTSATMVTDASYAGQFRRSDASVTDNSIHQNEPVVNPQAKENVSEKTADEKGEKTHSAEKEPTAQRGEILRSEAVEGKAEETGAENAQDETAGASPRPTGASDGEVDLEKARRDAQRLIEWEKKNAPTVEELNTAREYVKGFDYLPKGRQTSIIRTIRSAKGVDVDIVKGVVNLMAIANKKGELLTPDLEIRFAEGIGKRGIKTRVGNKTVIVLDSQTKYHETIRGTIAHEVVHYMENRKGYKALADFAMKHAKAEKVAEVRETYTDYYRGVYEAEERAKMPDATDDEIAARVEERLASAEFKALVDSEVVASVVGEMLGSEKFLKRYARISEESGSVIKRIGRLIKGIVSYLKDKDDKASGVAAQMASLFDKALGSEVAGEKTGEKYSVIQKDGVYYTPTDEEIIKNHPTINGVIINDAEYSEGHTLPDDEYKAYRKAQAEKAKKVVGTYTNKDTTYSEEYGLITAEFKTPAIRKGKSYGGIALYDILPYVPQIFENAVVINTKPDSELNTNIKGIVNLVGCAILNDKYVAVVKLNVKEYANDEAKIYDNRVIEIEELTVVDRVGHREVKTSSDSTSSAVSSKLTVVERVGHQEVKTSSDSTSSAVSSKYIIAKFREFVKNNDEKKSLTNSDIKDSTERYDLDPDKVRKQAKKKPSNESKTKSEEQERSEKERKQRRSKEERARDAVMALFANEVRTYTKADFKRAFARAAEIAPEVIGKILDGKTVGMDRVELDRILSDVYVSMYRASYKGEVGAVDAVRTIAQKAAKYFVEHQRVEDSEAKRYVSLKRYIDDADTLKTYEDALAEVYFESFSTAGLDLKKYKDFESARAASEHFKSMYLNFKDLQKYKKKASDNAADLKRLADMQKRSAADEGVRLLAKAMGDTVDKHGNIRGQKIDAALAQVSDFYNQETNTKFFGEDNSGTLTDYAQEFDRGIREKIDVLIDMRKERQGKPLTMMEMRLWADILGGMRATINAYNGLYREGKWFDRTKVANDLANDIVDYFGFGTQKESDNKFLAKIFNLKRKIKEAYFYSVLTPETVIEGLEGYAHRGVLKTFFHSVRDATQLAEKQFVELVIPFEQFLDSKDNTWSDGKKKHKYRDKLNEKKIDLFGHEITLGEAIYVYGLTKREHAQAGLAGEGIKIYGEDGRVKKHIREIDSERAREYLYQQFDDVDKKYIEMVEEFFNKTSTEIKSHADIEYLGYTNTIEGYYIPILRDRLSRDARTTDRRSSIADTITVYNERFNKHTVKNAKPCEVVNIQQVINMHAKGLADYANLYMPLKSFDRLYNAPVILKDGRNTTIREILNDVWPDSKSYLADLFGDIQGIGRPVGRFDTINEAAQKLTNRWVPSVLSANVSVVLTQTTSYVAAFQDIELSYLVRALGAVGKNWSELSARADKYSKITLARNFDQGAIRSQTNVERVGNIGKILGAPTEWTDRHIVLLIYHACELKAEAEGVGAIGTEANAKRAAELCDKTIYDTQSMTSRAERSAWQRSPNLFARAVTQFTSDAMKQLSHLYSNIAKYTAHKKRADKNPNDTTYSSMLKNDRKAILRSATTVAATSAAMAGIAWAVRLLFNTVSDESEEEWSIVGWDFIGNVIGIMPLVSDIYDLFKDGYDITPTSMEIVNDTVTGFRDMCDVIGSVMSGEYVSSEDIIKPVRTNFHSLMTLIGVPSKPIEKTVFGLIRRVSPSSTFSWDSMFSSASYTKELQKALDNGDEKMARAVLETMWRNDINSAYIEEELLEICRLYQLKDEEGNYRSEVLPSKIPSEITSAKQRARFEAIYGEASGAVVRLVGSLEYQNLTDEERITAIKNTYRLYYDKAKSTVLGEEITNAQAYAMLMDDTSNLFLAQAKKSTMKAYKDMRGKEVTVKEQLSKYLDEIELDDTERLIITYALGYKSKENKTRLLAYINSLNLSEEEKTQIAKRLGFAVVNGRVVEQKDE